MWVKASDMGTHSILRGLDRSLRPKSNLQHELFPRSELDVRLAGRHLHLLSGFKPFLVDVAFEIGFIVGDPGSNLGGLLKPESGTRIQISLQSQTGLQ